MQMPHLDQPGLKRVFRYAAAWAFLLALLAACASTPQPPTQSLNDARRGIEDAEQSDARQYAAAELDEARRQLELAERAVDDERMAEADRYARQAQIASELAMARTDSAKAAEINHEMRRSTQALLEEMRRTGDGP
jgi:hypothetical protein